MYVDERADAELSLQPAEPAATASLCGGMPSTAAAAAAAAGDLLADQQIQLTFSMALHSMGGGTRPVSATPRRCSSATACARGRHWRGI